MGALSMSESESESLELESLPLSLDDSESTPIIPVSSWGGATGMKFISPMRGMLPAGVMPVKELSLLSLLSFLSLLVFGYLGEDLTVVKLEVGNDADGDDAVGDVEEAGEAFLAGDIFRD